MTEKARIRWLCRRGMKELDVLLERFVGADYDELDERQLAELRALLDKEDPDLFALIMERSEPDNEIQAELLGRIRMFQRPGATG